MKQPHQANLAERLGEPAHVSPLLRVMLAVSGCSVDTVGEWLLKCAVERGAFHYEREFSSTLPSDHRTFSDEEIAVALCLGEHPYNSVYIRAAAQLLSSTRVDPARLARLAMMERVEPILLHIARTAERFDASSEPWRYLRRHLKTRRAAALDALPHWSRFVSQTGVTAFGGPPEIKWLSCRTGK